MNYLDDRIISDLRDQTEGDSVPQRVRLLVRSAAVSGAQAVMLTCSFISQLAVRLGEEEDVPVLRIDEAMADEAVRIGNVIAVVATLSTTCGPTEDLIRERARDIGRSPEVQSVIIDGAFDAIARGYVEEHNRRVQAAVAETSAHADVVVLAQASMVQAAPETLSTPLLTSVKPGVRRLRDFVASRL